MFCEVSFLPPKYHSIFEDGREPADWHVISYSRPILRGSLPLSNFTINGGSVDSEKYVDVLYNLYN